MRAYLKDVRGEMKKVTWPSKNDLYKTTVAVIVISLFFGVYLFGVDFIFSRIFKQIRQHLPVGNQSQWIGISFTCSRGPRSSWSRL